MNDYLLSVFLGIIEGLTEFLPVSSTAHLRIAEALFHISLSDGYWKMYTIVIQLGAILCLPVYFRERIAKFLSTFPQGESGDRTAADASSGLDRGRFCDTAVPAFLLTKIIGKHLENLSIMGVSLLIGGVVMWIVDAMNASAEAAGPGASGSRIHTWKMEAMSLGQAHLDRRLPDSVGGVSRDVAVDVHNRRWATGGNVAGFGAGIFVFSFHPDHGGGDRLRPAEVAARQEARIQSECRRSMLTDGWCWRSASWFRFSWPMRRWPGSWPGCGSTDSRHSRCTGLWWEFWCWRLRRGWLG